MVGPPSRQDHMYPFGMIGVAPLGVLFIGTQFSILYTFMYSPA